MSSTDFLFHTQELAEAMLPDDVPATYVILHGYKPVVSGVAAMRRPTSGLLLQHSHCLFQTTLPKEQDRLECGPSETCLRAFRVGKERYIVIEVLNTRHPIPFLLLAADLTEYRHKLL